MSISIAEKKRYEKSIDNKIKKLTDQQQELEEELEKFCSKYSNLLTCNKCKLVFEPEEVGYKKYKVRRTVQHNFQYGGEYSIYQIVEYQYLACCPVCGKNFGVQVRMPDTIDSTKVYSRWEDKPDFKEDSCVCVDKEIHKLDKYNIKVLKENL